jgi:glycosyltransferase involved in cell wall biosynthesis
MKKIYRLSTMLVFPSLEETFGLPVLEAMAAGLPVVTSNRSALPEVAGEAALLVNPENPEEIAAAVRRILDSPELRRELIRKGHERAREFPWERTARETLAVYRRLTSN